MKNIITLKNVSKSFDDSPDSRVEVVHDVTLDIHESEFFIFVGPSGSGKSTLLRIMSKLESRYKGSMVLGEGSDSQAFVFQQFGLMPWLTVYQNVELALIGQRIPLHLRREKIINELKSLGLEKSIHAYPRELSGGMRQRVGIARAFVTNPKVVFMDEPFSELDSFTAEELRKEVLRLWQERKMTIVMVTHIVEEALELADRIAVLTPGPGKIEKIVTNPLPRPRSKRSPAFYALEDELYKLIRP